MATSPTATYTVGRPNHDQRDAREEPRRLRETEEGDILAEEAGDCGGHGDDRRPRGEFTGDDVELVVLLVEVGLETPPT
jgi:hypothetical protein